RLGDAAREAGARSPRPDPGRRPADPAPAGAEAVRVRQGAPADAPGRAGGPVGVAGRASAADRRRAGLLRARARRRAPRGGAARPLGAVRRALALRAGAGRAELSPGRRDAPDVPGGEPAVAARGASRRPSPRLPKQRAPATLRHRFGGLRTVRAAFV